jgi:hypothetical protein
MPANNQIGMDRITGSPGNPRAGSWPEASLEVRNQSVPKAAQKMNNPV